MITAKLLQYGGFFFSLEGGNNDNGEIAAIWGTISIEGGNSDNGEIAAKWGNFGTHFGHFCPLASKQKVEIVITAKLLQNGGNNPPD